ASSDQRGEPSSPAVPLDILVSTCGSASVTATDVATQHFDGIAQEAPGEVTPTTAPLDMTLTPPSQSPLATLTVSGTPRTFVVPFYLDREISVDATISLPAACAGVQLTGVQLLDPTFTPVPPDRFTPPSTPATVTNGQHLQFTFTARIGDTPNGGGGTNPGLYTLQLLTTSGSVNTPLNDIVQPDPIRVGGRC